MRTVIGYEYHGSRLMARVSGWKAIKPLFILPFLSLPLTACVTDAEFLAQNSSAALAAAESRGKFELNCPQVSSSILSQKIDEAVTVRAGYSWAEYTIGIRGCGKQAVYITVCRDQNNCNALAQTGRVLEDAP